VAEFNKCYPKIAEIAAAARIFSKMGLDFASVDFSLQSYTSVSIDRNTRWIRNFAASEASHRKASSLKLLL
jgi:hypothetical protein